MKFFRMTIICLLVLVLVPTMAFAKEKNVDQKLKDMGTPKELIDLWSPTLKQQIVDGSLNFVSYTKVSPPPPPSGDGGVVIYGSIPTTQFDYYVTVFDDGLNANNREQKSVVITCKWLPGQMPFWRLTDPYGAAFDSAVWRLKDGGGYWEDIYAWHNTPNTWITFDSGTAYSYTASNGVGFNADIKGDAFSDYVEKQNSSGLFKIEGLVTGNISGSSQIQSNYYHTIGTGSIGLAFGPLSVSFNGSASTDSRGTTKSFNY